MGLLENLTNGIKETAVPATLIFTNTYLAREYFNRGSLGDLAFGAAIMLTTVLTAFHETRKTWERTQLPLEDPGRKNLRDVLGTTAINLIPLGAWPIVYLMQP